MATRPSVPDVIRVSTLRDVLDGVKYASSDVSCEGAFVSARPMANMEQWEPKRISSDSYSGEPLHENLYHQRRDDESRAKQNCGMYEAASITDAAGKVHIYRSHERRLS